MKREIKLLAVGAFLLCIVFALVPVIEQPKLSPVSVTAYEKSTFVTDYESLTAVAEQATYTSNNENPKMTGKVNINTASAAQLTSLPGIGEVKAEAIITYRQEHGKFTSPGELINVKGIGEKTLEKILPYITAN